MQIGPWQFKPRLLPSLATLILFPALLALGFWQLDRAEQKRSLFMESMQYRQQPPLRLHRQSETRLRDRGLLWRPVEMSGEFDPGHILLLDNQVLNGKAGYFVYMPFRLAGSTATVLVNRGWIGAGSDRQEAPEVTAPAGTVMLRGIIKDAPSTGIFLGESAIETLASGTYRLQRIRIEEIEQVLDENLLPYVVRLQPDSAHGFARKWPQAGSGEAKHLGYAFQWFALALTLLVIYIVVNCKKTGGHTNG